MLEQSSQGGLLNLEHWANVQAFSCMAGGLTMLGMDMAYHDGQNFVLL